MVYFPVGDCETQYIELEQAVITNNNEEVQWEWMPHPTHNRISETAHVMIVEQNND
jgi:hypothetical protein